jgi:G3E family GTPase
MSTGTKLAHSPACDSPLREGCSVGRAYRGRFSGIGQDNPDLIIGAPCGKVAIIENEIGQVGIDDKFLRKAGLPVRELYSGCICCQLVGNLVTTLKALHKNYAPDLVIIEPTGVAEPGNVRQALQGFRDEPLNWVRAVVVVDPTRLEALLEIMTPLITSQIQDADWIAVNKIEKSSGEEMDLAYRTIGDLNPHVAVQPISAQEGTNVEELCQEVLA